MALIILILILGCYKFPLPSPRSLNLGLVLMDWTRRENKRREESAVQRGVEDVPRQSKVVLSLQAGHKAVGINGLSAYELDH